MAPFKTRKPFAPRAPEGAWVHDRAQAGGVARAVSGVAASTAAVPAANTRLVVSNLHYEITAKDLMAIFGQVGTLTREPMIRYDRSGRSSGAGVVTFETAAEAARAKDRYQGALAKGQPMEIEYEVTQRRHHRSASAPSTLMQRIQKGPLIERLGRAETQAKESFTKGSRGGGGIARGRGRGRVSVATGTPRQKGPGKSATDLDRELDAFMGDGEAANSKGRAERQAARGPATADQDVEMA